MKMTKMNPVQYAQLRSISPAGVTKAIRKAKLRGEKPKLPGVIKVETFSKYYVLTCNMDEIKSYVSGDGKKNSRKE